MTDREAMQMALEALEDAYDAINCWGDYASQYFQEKHGLEEDITNCKKAIEALRTPLAQGEQDTECSYCNGSGCVACDARCLPQGEQGAVCISTYQPGITTREWQGLTGEDIEAAFMANTCCDDLVVFEHIARAIEAKLKEKNGY